MSSYTCISCRVQFSDGEVQRAHYKTDWHRYNLKRKVADMPPVTAENFQERVLAQRAAADQQGEASGQGSTCATCNKKFSSANAYTNHLQSNKHQQAEKKALAAAQEKVQRMNEKNLEKGTEMDKDAQNEALQQALREQQRHTPSRTTSTEKREKTRPDVPPRLLWFEQQAKKLAAEEGAEVEEEEWEDVDEDDDDDDDDDYDMEAEEEEAEEQVEEGPASKPTPPPGAIPVTNCLFCGHHSRTLSKNMAHMTKEHTFFLPDVEYLVDLEGLIAYLGEKVGVGNVCLWCNEKGRSFYSVEAVRGHMFDKSHCKLYTDGDAALEFADFYDFRSSYPDAGDVEMNDGELPDEKNVEFDEDTLELTLPSGAKVGHRSLMRYYKQHFRPQKAVVRAHNQKAVGRVLKQYRALGYGGDAGKGFMLQQQKDMACVQRMKSRWILKMGMNNNATKQPHFRAQVMF
ncbi:zinc finger protein 622 [Chanos chanos]|uniref:Cytoplasmic 60S subunit biogenesis factor ZNF622 n=1 Tax=Chanos chanos TaxID=29144 RepID=A0A6J2VF13_CHACN|nr:zinc finger protein 622 [Chanos chanos]